MEAPFFYISCGATSIRISLPLLNPLKGRDYQSNLRLVFYQGGIIPLPSSH